MGLVCDVSGVEARDPQPPKRPDNQTTQGKRPKRAMHFCFVFKTRMGLDGPSYLQASQKERIATPIRPSSPTKAQRPRQDTLVCESWLRWPLCRGGFVIRDAVGR